MSNRLGIKLQHVWCLISVFSLILPLCLSSYADTPAMFNIMTPVLVIMMVAACPFSLLTLPLFVLFKVVLGLEPDSMFGAYFYTILINIIGYVQWFWLMPKVSGRSKPFVLPSILNNG